MDITEQIKFRISKISGFDQKNIILEHPEIEEFGDYSSNIALVLKGGRKLAEEIADKLNKEKDFNQNIGTASVAGPGFVNFILNKELLFKAMHNIVELNDVYGRGNQLAGKKIMVEYAHPNTHKELHVGHMRTLITGEALSRILENAGANVFRANYQGDVGPHVAKSIWGTMEILKEKNMSWEDAEKMSLGEKAHLLGLGYARGNMEYEDHKQEVDDLNNKIYAKDKSVEEVYKRTRRWSLDYYDIFYKRFYTKFDRLYFESEVAEEGKRIVLENRKGMTTGRQVFEDSEGAVIFNGEKFGLHKRVFITQDGNTTYEGKDMALAYEQYADFPFDKNIHVVANEQTGYFKVIIKALELMEPKFKGREYHLPMGMVNLVGRKMSSRTGDILTVDRLIDEVKEILPVRSCGEKDEAISIGAVKYSILKTHPKLDVAFDIKQSVNLEGNSGPYIQYTYARIQSVLRKSASKTDSDADYTLNKQELHLLRYLYRFPEITEEAAKRLSPNLLCNYLFEIAGRFNSFYNQHSILSADKEKEIRFRLTLTRATGNVLKNGLFLLGIKVLEKM